MINPKHEIPAFAEAASRRQANFKTISNIQNTKAFLFGSFKHLVTGFVLDFDIRISNLLKSQNRLNPTIAG